MAAPLGTLALTALVMGNMIGAGVFLLPTTLARFGSIGLLSWVATAAGAMLLALTFAAISASMPVHGGPYRYCKDAMGDRVAFMVAYNYWLAMWVGSAATVVAMVGYLEVLLPALADPYHAFVCAVTIIWFLTWINLRGVAEAAHWQTILTGLKLLPLLMVMLLGVGWFRADHLYDFNVSGLPNSTAFSQAAALTLWSFIGLESATIPAESVRRPHVQIPVATILGTLGAAVIYIGSATVIMGMFPVQFLQQSTAPYADACHVLMGPWGEKFIAFGAVIACFGTLNGWILLQGQLPQAMARDGLFPKVFAKLNQKQVPDKGLIICAVLITALLSLNIDQSLAQKFEHAIALAVLATLFPYLFTSISALILLIRQRSQIGACSYVLRMLLFGLSGLYSCWMIHACGYQILWQGLLLALTGLPIYIWVQGASNTAQTTSV